MGSEKMFSLVISYADGSVWDVTKSYSRGYLFASEVVYELQEMYLGRKECRSDYPDMFFLPIITEVC